MYDGNILLFVQTIYYFIGLENILLKKAYYFFKIGWWKCCVTGIMRVSAFQLVLNHTNWPKIYRDMSKNVKILYFSDTTNCPGETIN